MAQRLIHYIVIDADEPVPEGMTILRGRRSRCYLNLADAVDFHTGSGRHRSCDCGGWNCKGQANTTIDDIIDTTHYDSESRERMLIVLDTRVPKERRYNTDLKIDLPPECKGRKIRAVLCQEPI
ncbi:hypothetical protein [Mollivirus kamchatka]|nr:hypothetical protein [Mollivirus kamchatka]